MVETPKERGAILACVESDLIQLTPSLWRLTSTSCLSTRPFTFLLFHDPFMLLQRRPIPLIVRLSTRHIPVLPQRRNYNTGTQPLEKDEEPYQELIPPGIGLATPKEVRGPRLLGTCDEVSQNCITALAVSQPVRGRPRHSEEGPFRSV